MVLRSVEAINGTAMEQEWRSQLKKVAVQAQQTSSVWLLPTPRFEWELNSPKCLRCA